MTVEIDIKKLSEIHDTRPTFLTLYMNLEKENREFMDNRAREIRAALASKPELLRVFGENLFKAQDYIDRNAESLKRKGHAGIALFVSVPMDFFEVQPLPVGMEDSLIVDASPYIRPIAMFLEEYEDFGIILIDHNHARIYLVKAGEIEETDRLYEQIFHHHKKGGWSQMRFQRKRQGELVHFYKEVAEAAEKVFEGEKIRRLIIAGQSDAKKNFIPYLPKRYQDMIIAVLNIETETPDEDVVKDAFPVFFEKEREEEAEIFEELMDRIMKGEGAAYGLRDVLDKTKNGRSETVIINMDFKAPGYKCEKCNIVELHPGKCPICGSPLHQVDAVEELVEWAKQTDAEVEFVKHNDSLESLGGVGALLRW